MAAGTTRKGATPMGDAADDAERRADQEREEGNVPDDETVDADAVEIVEETFEQGEELIQPSQELVLHERAQSPAPTQVLPSPQEWEATMTMAKTIAGTPFVPTAYRGQPEAVVAAILYGREIGLGPMQALQKIHMIDGKPSLSADLMLAQMRKGGIKILASESTRERAAIHAKRSDTGEEADVEWTIEEARQIQTRERGQTITLDQKATWRSYPADMLWARAVGRLARRLGSDLLGGVMPYASEEMQDWDEGDYGGNGYDTTTQAAAPAAAAPVTSGGVELRADAPRGWQEMKTVLEGIDAKHPWGEWLVEACEVICNTNLQTLRDIPEPLYKDCLILCGNAVANLVEARGGADFPPPTRADVQAAFSRENAVGKVLTGPAVPLDPQEAALAAEMAAADHAENGAERAADAPEATEAGQDTPESAEGEPAPLGKMEPNTDDVPFGEEDKADGSDAVT